MSSLIGSNAPIPYVAPWAAQFNRYSTQILNMVQGSATQYTLKIPSGQWWRVVFAQVTWQTSATAGTRQALFKFQTPSSQAVVVASPGTQGVSLFGTYMFGANLSAYTVTIAGNSTTQVTPWPDLMWSPNTTLTSVLDNNQANDLATNTPFVAVEIYTEHTDPDTGTSVLLPTPTLT